MGSWMLQWFDFGQLPPHLQAISVLFQTLANDIYTGNGGLAGISKLVAFIETNLGASPEATWAQTHLNSARLKLEQNVGLHGTNKWDMDLILRDVLQAKDCAVRARVWQVKQGVCVTPAELASNQLQQEPSTACAAHGHE